MFWDKEKCSVNNSVTKCDTRYNEAEMTMVTSDWFLHAHLMRVSRPRIVSTFFRQIRSMGNGWCSVEQKAQ